MILEHVENNYYIECEACGHRAWYQKNKCHNGARKFCSKKCVNKGRRHSVEWKTAMSIRNAGRGNPFYGKTHTQINKNKCRQNGHQALQIFKTRCTPEEWAAYKTNLSKIGETNGFYGKTHSDISKKQMSETRSRKISVGEIKAENHRGEKGFVVNKSNQQERFDSFYEYCYMQYLNQFTEVTAWTKKHGIRIPYELFGTKHNYIPDFLVTKNGKMLLVEIKGYEEPNKKLAKKLALANWATSQNYDWLFLEKLELNVLVQSAFGYSVDQLRKKHKKGAF